MTRLLFALTLLTTAPAAGQDAAARASALISEGVALRQRGDDAGALARFEAAHQLAPSGRALAQIALAEQALGRWLSAETHLEAALAGTDPWVSGHRALLEQSRREIQGNLGSLDVVGLAGAEVRVNGEPAGTLPLARPVRVVAGTAVVEVRASGHVAFTRTITVPAGGLWRESVQLVPEPRAEIRDPVAEPPHEPADPRTPLAAPAPLDTRDADAASPLRTIGWVAIGASVLAIAGGSVALVIRNEHVSAYNSDDCLAGGRTRGENCRDDYDAAVSAGAWSIAGFVTAGAFAAGGIALVLAGAPSDDAVEVSLSVAGPVLRATW